MSAEEEHEGGSPYTESPVIITTVRAVSPFILTYGIFITLHGANSPGGGFQGGVVMASVAVLFGFAFGIGPTREWIDGRVLLGIVAAGIFVFAGIGLLAPLLNGNVLQLDVMPIAVKWSIEIIEVAIGAIVAGVVAGLFFVLSQGTADNGGDGA